MPPVQLQLGPGASAVLVRGHRGVLQLTLACQWEEIVEELTILSVDILLAIINGHCLNIREAMLQLQHISKVGSLQLLKPGSKLEKQL